MCFTIPYRVISVAGKSVVVEGNKKVLLGEDITARKGEFVQVLGNIAVSKLSKGKGESVRRLIAQLSKEYDG